MLTKQIIENRIQNFRGYGNIDSDIWFLGMEEGFGGTMDDFKERFLKSHQFSMVDVYEDMKTVKDHIQWFLPNNKKIQRTMGKLIFLFLEIRGKKADKESILYFQNNLFGRKNGDHCSLELMPLPCRSVNEKDRFYNQFGIEYLESRRSYVKEIMPKRIKLFRDLIQKKQPEIVICYSFSYLKKWQEIIDKPLQKIDNLYYVKTLNTHFFVIPHSTAHGLTIQNWKDIALKIKEIIS